MRAGAGEMMGSGGEEGRGGGGGGGVNTPSLNTALVACKNKFILISPRLERLDPKGCPPHSL